MLRVIFITPPGFAGNPPESALIFQRLLEAWWKWLDVVNVNYALGEISPAVFFF